MADQKVVAIHDVSFLVVQLISSHFDIINGGPAISIT